MADIFANVMTKMKRESCFPPTFHELCMRSAIFDIFRAYVKSSRLNAIIRMKIFAIRFIERYFCIYSFIIQEKTKSNVPPTTIQIIMWL